MSIFQLNRINLLILRCVDQHFQVIQIRLCHPSNQKLNGPPESKIIIKSEKELDVNKVTRLKSLSIYKLAEPYITKRINEVYTVYERMSGLDEVKEAQNRVYKIQDLVKDAQDRKRDLVHQLGLLRSELKQLHVDIMNCQRGEPRYLDLIKREIEVTRNENEKMKLYELVDTEERELFAHFTSSLQMSQEKGRAQADKVKYWGFIVSILVGVLSVIGTIITYNYRSAQTADLKKQTFVLQQTIEKLDISVSELASLKTTVDKLEMSVQKLNISINKRSDRQGQQGESWMGYFGRKLGGIYRYVFS